MPVIISKRHKYGFYFSLIIGTIFFLGMAVVMTIIYIKESDKGALKAKDQLMPIFAGAVFILSIYTIFRYFKSAPNIRIEDDQILFGSKTYSLAEIEKINLTGKQNFRYLIPFPMEAAALHFKNGETIFIFDMMYENAWEMKSYLKHVFVDKSNIAFQQNLPISQSEISGEIYDSFKGNPFTSLRGIIIWGFLLFMFYILMTSKNVQTAPGVILLAVFSAAWAFFQGWMMHYFEVSNSFFVIKNHVLFWKKKVYRLSDIDEVVFETQQKMPNCLRIISKNYKSKMYPAGTLRDKTWLELKEKLETHHIKVRNECI